MKEINCVFEVSNAHNFFLSLSSLFEYPKELPNRDFDCLWCESYTHKTIDCVEMKRTKECGNNHDADASYSASDNFQNRSPLDWFADSGASRHMTKSEGYIITGKEDHVCRLLKPIYGLKQASRCWYSKFNEAILLLGFSRCLHDPCVYYRFTAKGEYTIMVIYVDDGLVSSNIPGVLTETIEFLKTHFKVRSLPANRFVGLNISRDCQKQTLSINQSDFIKSILKRYGMAQCDPINIPANPNRRLKPEMSPKTAEERSRMKKVPYRECIGSLMYLMAMTRPYIVFSVNQVAVYVSDPGEEHWSAVNDILAYLRRTIHHGICYGDCHNSTLLGYTDADWAGELEKRKSTTGVLFLFNGGPVSYGSRRQRATALSTRDAEFYAACEGAKESIWLKSLLLEIGFDVGRVSIRCDSKCALALINGEESKTAKYIDVRCFFTREQQELGNILVTHIRGKEQPADIFTKPLPQTTFKNYREQIGV